MQLGTAPSLKSVDHPSAHRRRWQTGCAVLDKALAGGMTTGCVHEIYTVGIGDSGSAMGFAAALACVVADDMPVLWLRTSPARMPHGLPQGQGLVELGVDPATWLFGVASSHRLLLQSTADALRCTALGAVIVESWGAMREWDLTASRRLTLAAEKSGVPLLLLRIAAQPVPSAAQTRWQVKAAPSHAFPAAAPGLPSFSVELLRQRGGPSGLHGQLEWDREQYQFRETTPSGDMVPVSSGRTMANDGGGAWQHAQRRAA